jgi:hypothetical protein
LCTRWLSLCLSGLFCHASQSAKPRFETTQLGSEFFLLHSSPERVRSHRIAPSWEVHSMDGCLSAACFFCTAVWHPAAKSVSLRPFLVSHVSRVLTPPSWAVNFSSFIPPLKGSVHPAGK